MVVAGGARPLLAGVEPDVGVSTVTTLGRATLAPAILPSYSNMLPQYHYTSILPYDYTALLLYEYTTLVLYYSAPIATKVGRLLSDAEVALVRAGSESATLSARAKLARVQLV